MIKIYVEISKDSKKIMTYLQSKYPKLSKNALYKALRNKDIRVNGVKISENIDVYSGDEITLYIKDEVLYGLNSVKTIDKSGVVYESDDIIIINKPAEILVQSSGNEIGLDKMVCLYCNASVIPCHRLDRNTSGLIIFAKNKESEIIISDMIKNNNIKKYYKCLIYGHPNSRKGTLKGYLFKDSHNSLVIISDFKKKGYVEITTKYSVLEYYNDNTSLLEVELVTGRTHQIRAHLAHAGYPIIGDGKYGINEVNKRFGKKYQELTSYKIVFEEAYDRLEYLKGKEIKLK